MRETKMKIYAPNRKRFTIIDNTPINDSALSPCALGMLVYLWSKPDGWELFIGPLMRRFGCGKSHIYSCLTLLENAGYLTRQRLGNGTVISKIYERPNRIGLDATIEPHPKNPDQGFRDVRVKTDSEQRLSKRLSNKEGSSNDTQTLPGGDAFVSKYLQ
jgi:hypothetical protein